jgi:hypothetical protein
MRGPCQARPLNRFFEPEELMKRIHGIVSSMLKKGVVLAILVATPTVATAGRGGSNRPYAAACDTAGTVIQTTPVLRISFDLVCQSRHLGETTGVLVLDVIPTGAPVNGVLPVAGFAPVRYVAANGDALHATWEGSGDINLATGIASFAGFETFEGGTGRFADASGRSFLDGTASTVTNLGVYTSVGRISY